MPESARFSPEVVVLRGHHHICTYDPRQNRTVEEPSWNTGEDALSCWLCWLKLYISSVNRWYIYLKAKCKIYNRNCKNLPSNHPLTHWPAAVSQYLCGCLTRHYDFPAKNELNIKPDAVAELCLWNSIEKFQVVSEKGRKGRILNADSLSQRILSSFS